MDDLTELANGEILLHDFIEQKTTKVKTNPHDARRERFRVIAGSKKPLFIADVPESAHKDGMARVSLATLQKSRGALRNKQVPEALALYRQAVREMADVMRQRNAYIAESLKVRLPEFIKTHPTLKDRAEIKVLVHMGAAHTQPFHEIRRAGHEERMVFNYMPYIFLSSEANLRKLIHHPEVELSDEEVKRAIISTFIESRLSHAFCNTGITMDSDLIAIAAARMTTALSLEQVDQFFQGIQSGKSLKMLLDQLTNFPQDLETVRKIANVREG